MERTEHIIQLQKSLYSEIHHYTPVYGIRMEPNNALKEAFFNTPRHLFVDKFRLVNDLYSEPITHSNDNALDYIYSNVPLMYVSSNNENYMASSSEPAFILHLLSLLDIRPGQKVLEIGCGTGWLLSIISQLVGNSGECFGIEIIEELANKAKNNINNSGITNATVITGDGYENIEKNKFDRIIFTASTFLLPNTIINALNDDGKLLVPLKNRGLAEEVFLLEKQGNILISKAARLCKFVEMISESPVYSDPSRVTYIPEKGTIPKLLSEEKETIDFSFGGKNIIEESYAGLHFSSFLSKTAQNFSVHSYGPNFVRANEKSAVYGDPNTLCYFIVDEKNNSMAMWNNGKLTWFGNTEAKEYFEDKYSSWCSYGRPHGANFSLKVSTISNSKKTDPIVDEWLEERGGHRFLWSL